MIADVERYAEFLPWCDSVEVLSTSTVAPISPDESAQGSVVEARVTVGAKGIRQSFVSRNHMQPPDRIELTLAEGPFDEFLGTWTFTSLVDAALAPEAAVLGCKVELDLRFAFARSKPILRRTFGALFERSAATLVDSFCARAHVLFGARQGGAR